MSENADSIPNPALMFKDQKTRTIIDRINHMKFAPKYGGEYKAGDVIRLEIPSQDWLDSSLFSISFAITISADELGTPLPDGCYHPDAPIGWGREAKAMKPTLNRPVWPIQKSTNAVPNDIVWLNPSTLAENFAQGNNATCATGSGVRMATCVQTIFNRIKLLQGSKVIEDIQDYNQLFRILVVITCPLAWRDTSGMLLEGYCDDIHAEDHYKMFAWAWEKEGHQYNVIPHLGLFKAGKYLPLKYMGQLTIELYLETDNDSLVSTVNSSPESHPLTADAYGIGAHADLGTPYFLGREAGQDFATVNYKPYEDASPYPTGIDFPKAYYIVKKVFAHIHFVVPMEEYDNAALEMINSSGLDIFFDTWSTTSRQITSASTTSLNFQERALSVKGCFVIMRNSNNIGDRRTDYIFSNNYIQEYQFRLGSQYYPSQPIDCKGGGPEAFACLMQMAGLWSDVSMSSELTPENWLPSLTTQHLREALPLYTLKGNSRGRFVMALDLDKSHGQLSGFNTVSNNVDIELQLKFPIFGTLKASKEAGYDLDEKNFQASYWVSDWFFGNAAKNTNMFASTIETYVNTNRGGQKHSDMSNFLSDLQYGQATMHQKTASSFVRVTAYVNLDAVMRLVGVGNIVIER